MGAARYVGRVGGLAVALGVGTAILGGHGVRLGRFRRLGGGGIVVVELVVIRRIRVQSHTGVGHQRRPVHDDGDLPPRRDNHDGHHRPEDRRFPGRARRSRVTTAPPSPTHIDREAIGPTIGEGREEVAEKAPPRRHRRQGDATEPVVENAVATHSAASEPPTSVEPAAEESKPKKVVERATTSVRRGRRRQCAGSFRGDRADPAAGRLARHLGANGGGAAGTVYGQDQLSRPPSTSTTVSSPAPTTERSHRRGTWS